MPRWELLRTKFSAAELVDGGSTGMNFQYGGRRDPNTQEFLDLEGLGYYWSANDQPQNISQLYIFESPAKGGRFRDWEWPKGSMLSVRFSRDQSLKYPNMHT